MSKWTNRQAEVVQIRASNLMHMCWATCVQKPRNSELGLTHAHKNKHTHRAGVKSQWENPLSGTFYPICIAPGSIALSEERRGERTIQHTYVCVSLSKRVLKLRGKHAHQWGQVRDWCIHESNNKEVCLCVLHTPLFSCFIHLSKHSVGQYNILHNISQRPAAQVWLQRKLAPNKCAQTSQM